MYGFVAKDGYTAKDVVADIKDKKRAGTKPGG